MNYLSNSIILLTVLILLCIGVLLLFIQLLSAKKKQSVEAKLTTNDTSLEEKLVAKYAKQQYFQSLEQLPIKVNKVNLDPKGLKPHKKLPLPDTAIPCLSEVVTAFYPVIRDGEMLKVVFKPEMMEQLKNGTAKMMEAKDGIGFRAMAVAAEGKQTIMEHAKLIKEIDPTLLFNASFQLASVVVAQQHMQQINQSLKQIKLQLEDIKNFQLDEYLFHAKGNIEYFEVRVIPHYKANGAIIDSSLRNRAEGRFDQTINMLPHMLEKQEELLKRVEKIRNWFVIGNIIGENKKVIDLIQVLNEYKKYQEIIDIYFKWLNEMYVPFLSICGCSDMEIKAVEEKIRKSEEGNLDCYEKAKEKVDNWIGKFEVKFRFNEDRYIESCTNAVKAELPKPVSKFNATPIINGIDQPLEMIVEYLDNNNMNTYLVETNSK